MRWDIRPAPRWGTIEVRACDGHVDASRSSRPSPPSCSASSSTSPAGSTRASTLPTIQPWFVRENKWRAARYGLDAGSSSTPTARSAIVVSHLRETMEEVADIAVDLKCAREFGGLETILSQGASSTRQTLVADAADGDLREVVHHLIREFRAGPTLREHLASLGH